MKGPHSRRQVKHSQIPALERKCMKNRTKVLLLAVLIALLTACGVSSPATRSKPATPKTAEIMVNPLTPATARPNQLPAGERREIFFEVQKPGKITLDASFSGTGLALILNGPGQVGYYARQDGNGPLNAEYTVTEADLAKGTAWRASLVNFSKVAADDVELHINRPLTTDLGETISATTLTGAGTPSGATPNSLPANGERELFFEVQRPGKISVLAEFSGTDLALILNGPGRLNAYERVDGSGLLKLEYKVTAEDLEKGTAWRLKLKNFSDTPAQKVALTLKHPNAASLTPALTRGQILTNAATPAGAAPNSMPAGDKREVFFEVRRPGKITVDASFAGTDLALILNGPAQRGFYERVDGSSPLKLEYMVTAEDVKKGTSWQLSLTNFSGAVAQNVLVDIKYPTLIGADAPAPACSDPVTFADANLEAAIRDRLGVTGAISKADLESLRSLPAAERGITSLEGLQCAVNLNIANLSNNNISDLTPLKDMTSFQRLVLTSNTISDVSPLAGLTDLIQLYLARNPISNISSLETLTKMRLLTLDRTDISDISVLSNYSNLGFFSGSNMGFSSLEPLRDLNELYSLRIRNNPFADLEPLRGKPKLRIIDVAGTSVRDVNPLGTLPELSHLFLFSNTIDTSTVTSLSSATNLEYLHMGGTGLNNLEFVRPLTNLTELIVYSNNISDLSPVAGLSNLEMLHFQLNQVSDISPVASLSNLKYFYALTNRISDLSPLASLPLDRITLGGNLISDIGPLVANANLERGDYLEVRRNCLDVDGDDKLDIEALEGRLGIGTTAGVGFKYDNQRRTCP